MILRNLSLALAASLLLTSPFAYALSAADIPGDVSVASLVASAKENLAKGNANDAVTYFDVAIAREPSNYLAIFQRGFTYLTLGRNSQASDDFDRVLKIKPDFEGALLQRARLHVRNGNWAAAEQDFLSAGKDMNVEMPEVGEAKTATTQAKQAEKAGKWEECVSGASIALRVEDTSLSLRKLRARCRMENGDLHEALADLQHVLQIAPGSIEPHLQISATLFFALGDREKGLAQVRKCLHSDPDSKPCSKLHREEKNINKLMKKLEQLYDSREKKKAVNLIMGENNEEGLLQLVDEAVKEGHTSGSIHVKAPNELYKELVEFSCDLYADMRMKTQAKKQCDLAEKLDPNSLPALLFKANELLSGITDPTHGDLDQVDQVLQRAKEHHPDSQAVQPLIDKVFKMRQRIGKKDYYKVLGLPRNADETEIKRAHRKLVKIHHPDKAAAQGLSKETSHAKMLQLNEAIQVLGDPEKKKLYDSGVDPNDPQQQGNPFQGSPFGHGPGGQAFYFQQDGGGDRRGGQRHGGGGHPFKFQQQGGGGFQFQGGFPF